MTKAANGCVRRELEAALAFLEEAYDRRSDRTIDHSLDVAQMLASEGQPLAVVIAGLLHDVVEDTRVTAGELRERFGAEVADIVAALTEDEGIADYEARKAALRRRTVAAGREAAKVALADKLSKVAGLESRPGPRRLAHYRATLDAVEAAYGPSPLSTRLREQLDRWPDPAS